jgi:transcriptional regulator with XRE-family HTH domain
LGDHIHKRRLDVKLLQKQAAEQFGVEETTVYNWESNATSPRIDVLPKVIKFLGYDPFAAPRSMGERLLSARRKLGLTQKALAKRLGMDPGTLARIERGKGRINQKTAQKVNSQGLISED